MSFEPLPAGYGAENLLKKGLFIAGEIGRDFDNIATVHRIAKRIACSLFKSGPEPENITVLECVYLPKCRGFVVVVTDGSMRNPGCRGKKT